MPDQDEDPEPLAIISLSSKFPGAASPGAFWRMMMERKCAATQYPTHRLGSEAQDDPHPGRLDSSNSHGGHFLEEDISLFDASFSTSVQQMQRRWIPSNGWFSRRRITRWRTLACRWRWSPAQPPRCTLLLPGPLQAYGVSDIDNALRMEESAQSQKKAVVSMGADDLVQVEYKYPYCSITANAL